MHVQYPSILEKPVVDTVIINKWLSSNLKGETEGLLAAAQDHAINTRNYKKVIYGQQIVSGCEVVVKTAYVSKYSEAAPYLHWNICKDHDIEITDKWYERKPETVTHNKHNNTIIITVVKDSVNSTCKLIDTTIPSDGNIALKEIGKKSKYKDLELETQRMWHVKTEVTPVVVGVLGTVKKGMVENIKKESERATVTETQTICMLGSAQSSGRCLLYEQND